MGGYSATAFHHFSTLLPTTQNLKAKNLLRGKVLTSECQIWHGLPRSIAGKATNNDIYCLGVLISCPFCNPKGEWIVRAQETFHIKHQHYSYERIILSTWHLMLGPVVMCVISKKCQCSSPLYLFSPLALLPTKKRETQSIWSDTRCALRNASVDDRGITAGAISSSALIDCL